MNLKIAANHDGAKLIHSWQCRTKLSRSSTLAKARLLLFTTVMTRRNEPGMVESKLKAEAECASISIELSDRGWILMHL